MFSNGSLSLWALSLLSALLALSAAQRRSQRIISSPDIPETEFSCIGRPPGYYADVETGCQVYHMCAAGGQQFSYKCPNTTLFQQRMLICAHWYQVNCSRSESHYGANLLIGQRDKPFVNENENTYYVNRKQVTNLTNPESLQHLSLSSSNRDQSARKPKAQSREVQLNNLKRSDTYSVANKQNTAASSSESLADNNAFKNFNTGRSTTQETKTLFNSFNGRVPTATTGIMKNTFNQETSVAPSQPFPPINRSGPGPGQFTTENRGVDTNFLPPPREEPTPTTTIKSDILTTSPKQVTPSLNFQSTTSVTDVTENTTQYPDLPNDEYNVFINRFNPNEETQTTTLRPHETTEYYTFIDRFEPSIEGFSSLPGMTDSEEMQTRPKAVRLIKIPLFDLEPPIHDSDESDSNQIELHFKDPRRTFFIPDSGTGELSNADDVPIIITIPLHTVADSPPMWFRTDKSKDPCARCHPSFIVNKNNCMPCVIIR